MAKFIIFTNSAGFESRNPFSLMDMGMDANENGGFGGAGGGTIAVIGAETGGCPRKVLVNNPDVFTNFPLYDLLLYVDETPNKSYIQQFTNACGAENVYVLLHSGVGNDGDNSRKTSQKTAIQDILGSHFEAFIEQSHSTNSIYWNELVEIAKCISADPFDSGLYTRLLDKLKSRWPNPLLESLIHLRKSLTLLPLRIAKGTLSNEPFDQAVTAIKGNTKTKMAVEKFLPNGSIITPVDLTSKLEEIDTEIIKLSTAR